MEERIETPSILKQLLRDNLSRYFSTDNVDRNKYINEMNMHLMSYDKKPIKLNNLKADLGDNYEKIMKMFFSFSSAYRYASEIRDALAKSSDNSAKNTLRDAHLNVCTKLPYIDFVSIRMFHYLIRNADLKEIPIPHPNTRDPTRNRMPSPYYDRENMTGFVNQ